MTEVGKREVARIAQQREEETKIFWEEETKNVLFLPILKNCSATGDKQCFILTDFEDACENLLKTLPLVVRDGCGQEVVRIND